MQSYKNPIIYIDYSDPDAIRVGDDYYMVASSFTNTPGLPLLHSKDLVNWELINYCIDNIPDKSYENVRHGCGVWAPSIRYHEGTFYVCFPMPDEGIYMTTSKDPYGKWSEPVNIRPGAGWIDPCPFWDEDGNAYLVAGVAKSRIGYKSVLHLVRMAADGMSIYGEEVKIFDGNENDQVTLEGPKFYKKNGYYYIFAPAGGVKPGWQTVLRSKNIWGPYEYKVVMRQGDSKFNGPHQGALLDTVTGEEWFIHFQDVFAAGRITLLEPVSWENDWPVIGVKSSPEKDYGEPVKEYGMPLVGVETKAITFDYNDDFTIGKVSRHWQWNANHKEDWSRIEKEGLLLRCLDREGRCLCDMPNLYLKKWAYPEFTSVAELDLSMLMIGDEAGFINLGVDTLAVGFKKTSEGYEVYKTFDKLYFPAGTSESEAKEDRMLIGRINSDFVYVKYVVRQTPVTITLEKVTRPQENVSLYVSTNGKDYTFAGDIMATAGRWVGVKYGFYSTGTGNLIVKKMQTIGATD